MSGNRVSQSVKKVKAKKFASQSKSETNGVHKAAEQNGTVATLPEKPPLGDTESEIPELAYEADLVTAIMRDNATMGLVGERDKGLLIYFAYSSRKLNKPISVILRGPSGSGKDELQRRPADLMPPEDVRDLMSITANAFYYPPEADYWKHKVVLGGERKHDDSDEQRDKTAAIRQMLSHGYVTKATVTQGLKGQFLRQDGPVSYSETTTKESIFQEDANRCLQLETDDSPDLTRKILQAQAWRYLPGETSMTDEQKQVKERHHLFQNSLNYVDVRIPYIQHLADTIPTDRIQIRRLFPQLQALIEVISFLHQHQRARNQHEQLEATFADYALARRLVLGSLHATIGMGKEFNKCLEIENKLPKAKSFTTTEFKTSFGTIHNKIANAALATLVEWGIVECIKKGSGNQPAGWRRTDKSMSIMILPTVEQIQERMKDKA